MALEIMLLVVLNGMPNKKVSCQQVLSTKKPIRTVKIYRPTTITAMDERGMLLTVEAIPNMNAKQGETSRSRCRPHIELGERTPSSGVFVYARGLF